MCGDCKDLGDCKDSGDCKDRGVLGTCCGLTIHDEELLGAASSVADVTRGESSALIHDGSRDCAISKPQHQHVYVCNSLIYEKTDTIYLATHVLHEHKIFLYIRKNRS